VHGVRGIIVSEEPHLARTPTDQDSKVDSYLDASGAAFVALCIPDNRLADGTIECRQNVVVEIQRAFDRPRVRHKVQVIKAPMCVLPSDINPTYDRLDVDDVAPRLMQSWPSFGLGAFLRASRIRGRLSAARR
jgi:hypothetical protein